MYCNRKAELLATRIIAIWVARQHTGNSDPNELIKEAGRLLAKEVNEHIAQQYVPKSDK